MKATLFLCRQLIHRIQTEWVLLMLSAVPLIAWGCIYFCMPLFVKYLDEYESFTVFLMRYGLLVDILMACIAPLIFGYVSTMLILEERDDGIIKMIAVSPAGIHGYYIARIVFPCVSGGIVTMILLSFQSFTHPYIWQLVFMTVFGIGQGMMVSLLTVAFSSNKLEGTAITKLGSVFVMSAAAAFFVPKPYASVFSIFPAYQTALAFLHHSLVGAMLAIVESVIWILVLYAIVMKRTQ